MSPKEFRPTRRGFCCFQLGEKACISIRKARKFAAVPLLRTKHQCFHRCGSCMTGFFSDAGVIGSRCLEIGVSQ